MTIISTALNWAQCYGLQEKKARMRRPSDEQNDNLRRTVKFVIVIFYESWLFFFSKENKRKVAACFKRARETKLKPYAEKCLAQFVQAFRG